MLLQFRLTGIAALALIAWVLAPTIALASPSQQSPDDLAKYYSAMEHLASDDVKQSAAAMLQLDARSLEVLTDKQLYNGAFVFALDGRSELAFSWLEELMAARNFDDVERLRSDPDFTSLHQDPRWDRAVSLAQRNKDTRQEWLPDWIEARLMAAEVQMANAKILWGTTFWDDRILVLDGRARAFTPVAVEGAYKVADRLFAVDLEKDEVAPTNSVQGFRGQRFVTIKRQDLDPYGELLLHELFHLLQERTLQLKGDPVPYLEEKEARVLLRAEYVALRQGLEALRNGNLSRAATGLEDAMLFRDRRHTLFAEGRQDSVDMETLEGLANYTGLVLSTYPDKHLVAIQWTKNWENSRSYTRNFPYATGPAFGLLMDAMTDEWRRSFDALHDFSKIYAAKFGPLDTSGFSAAKRRVGFEKIDADEQSRLDEFSAASDNLKQMFFEGPVIVAETDDRGYSVTFDMNGTVNLSDTQIVYGYVKAANTGGDQFGDFETTPGQVDGAFGVLQESFDGGFRYVFPGPVQQVGRTLRHPGYTITLNDGWELVATDDARVQKIVATAATQAVQSGDGKALNHAPTHEERSDAVLARRAYLGLAGEENGAVDGLRLTFVDDKATAGLAGLQVGDILHRVDGDAVSSMQKLIEIVQTKRAGGRVRFSISRSGQPLSLHATLQPRAQESADGLIVSYDSVAIEGGPSRIITYRPRTQDALPALFYLPGFSCASIDFGGVGDNPIRRFVEDIARRGFVVVRQEKPGLGDSVSTKRCEDLSFDEEVASFSKGVDWIKGQDFVDPDKVFFFGHSLGGVTAPALAAQHSPRGIITYGAPSRRWFEYKLDVFNEQPILLGRDPQAAAQRATIGIPFFRDVMTTRMPWPEIVKAHPEAIGQQIFSTKGQSILGRDFTFLRTLNAFDIEGAWRAYQGDVLALYGTFDIHVISDKDARNVVKLVNEDGGERAMMRVIKGAEHGFSNPNGTLDDYIRAMRFGQWTAEMALERYDPRLAEESVRWMERVLDR